MRSMTGFGRAEEYSCDLKCGFRVEISSINKKQFELKLNIPRELAPLEIELRTFVADRLARGSITLRIELKRHANFSRSIICRAKSRFRIFWRFPMQRSFRMRIWQTSRSRIFWNLS